MTNSQKSIYFLNTDLGNINIAFTILLQEGISLDCILIDDDLNNKTVVESNLYMTHCLKERKNSFQLGHLIKDMEHEYFKCFVMMTLET